MAELMTAYRLPRTVLPSRYDLTLEPNLDQARFSGSVVIALDVIEAVDEVWLNAAELNLTSAALETADGSTIPLRDLSLIESDERVRLTFERDLIPGPHRLRMTFDGILNDKLHGFYRSTFQDDSGTEHVIATTQFETADARRAFPCLDEPDFKAVFGVTLIVPESLFALSNGPVIEETSLGDGRRQLVFHDTMKMSTYLVAFIVGPFEATPPVDVDGIPLRVVHPIGKGHLTAYALEAGTFALRYLAKYYGIGYPDQKLDLVAVPDFAFGAMENVGCVTFREVLLLIDREQATEPELMRVADVIAHEIAHMWFGNLVTMRWWNGIWLNEAFATFMATMTADAFNRDWQRWAQFSLERTAAFEVDSLATTRPIEYPVNSPDDANGMFDLLTYEKGGAVLRMLEQYLGETPFQEGIHHYLTTHQFDNTETNDLWDAIEDVTRQPARRIMDSWIFQRGYPLISVDADTSGQLTLNQVRFGFTSPETAEAELNDQVWSVPVVLRYGRGDQIEERRELLETPSVSVDLGTPVDWVVANAGGHGFYRVRYTPDLLQTLTPVMMQQLDPIERYGLVDDTWASTLAGVTSAAAFVEFAQAFQDETDLDVWTALITALSQLDRILDGEARHSYQTVLRDLIRPALTRLGWEQQSQDSSRDLELRGLLLRSLAIAGADAEALAHCRATHDQYLRDSSSVEPNIAAAVATAVAITGSSEDYEVFVKRFQNAATPQEERRYQTQLAAFPGEAEIERTLEMCLNGQVRTQDAPYLVGQCMRNRQCGTQAWHFVQSHWDAMLEAYPDNSIVRMLDGVKSLSDPTTARDVEAFFETHSISPGELTLKQHLEKLRVNVTLREREALPLANFLQSSSHS